MGFRKKKSATRPDAPQPVDREHAAKLQRRAGDLTEPLEERRENNSSARFRQFQRQQIERKMAELRSEAVQARRLAEHIENLSRDTAAQHHKRKTVMTDTSIVDPGHAQRLNRRTDDRPSPGGNQLSFNPLHPSMELPPEQLIRLLGMESKKTRKVRKARQATHPVPAAPAEKRHAEPQQTPTASPRKVSQPDRSIQYERSEPPMFDSRHRGLLLPALLVGVVAGITVSGYLLWSQPVPVAEQEPAAVTAGPVQKPQAVTKPLIRKPVAKPVARSTAPDVAVTTMPAPAMSIQEQAQWQTAIQAENQRLRAAAEQRFAARVRQLEAHTEIAETAPAVESTALQPATEPALDEQPENTREAPQDRLTDSAPEMPAEVLPETSYATPLDEPLAETIETPAAAEDTYDSLPAGTVPLPEDTATYQAAPATEMTQPPPAPEADAPPIQDSVAPGMPATDTLEDVDTAVTPTPEDTLAIPEPPTAAETPTSADNPALF